MQGPHIYYSKADIPKNATTVEALESATNELWLYRHPEKRSNPKWKNEVHFAQQPDELWVYFPWSNIVVHMVGEKEYYLLRTSRNRHIISEHEQKNYRNLTVGIAGLSVGSQILHSMVMSGGPKKIRIADFDLLEVTNLNRIQAKLSEMGQKKIHIAAKNVWDVDPFADLKLYEDGLNEKNLEDFLVGEQKLDVFIDEMDSIELKIKSRLACKLHKIPVLMATDNGDEVILDVERFDEEPTRPIFHNNLPEIPNNLKDLANEKWIELAIKIIGAEFLNSKIKDSISSIGKTITGIPQLGPTAASAGYAVSLALRKIASGQPLPSGKFILSFEKNNLSKL